ncbi:MAG: amidohydrolase [Blastocatellia bacterium AA13]|nr:MAG: amidohydrolase [Blastocatellia bacterium AA13]
MSHIDRAILEPNDVEQLIADRRDFHRHPELKYAEERTAGIVAQRVESLGYEVRTGVGRSGVSALLKPASAAGPTLLYRADMDGLPIQEENNVEYRSVIDGVMHACGHDAHTAIGLAVAKQMASRRESLRGNLKFAFQPAEEGGNGAEAMINDGVLDNPTVAAAIGLHIWNNLNVGVVGVYAGPLMAAADEFEVVIHGRGGHGAMPQQTVDPIVTAAYVITALQTIVSRNIAPLDAAVVTVGKITAGEAFNIIPDTARLSGTVRTFNDEIYREIPVMVERVIKGTTEAFGATYSLDYRRFTPPVVNNSAMCDLVAAAAAEVVGVQNVIRDESVRTMSSEDMSYFLNRVPGCFFFLGSRNIERGLDHAHHSPLFDIDESAMEIGVNIMTRVIESYFDNQ